MEIQTPPRVFQPANEGLAEAAAQRMLQPSGRTELPALQVVSAIGAPPSLDNEPRERAATQTATNEASLRRAAIENTLGARQRETVRRVDRDEASQQLVFRSLDAETGEVIAQFPDELILRNRAYATQQAEAQASRGETQVERVA